MLAYDKDGVYIGEVEDIDKITQSELDVRVAQLKDQGAVKFLQHKEE